MIRTAGVWDRSHWPTYFLATDVEHGRLALPYYKHQLLAVNMLGRENDAETFKKLIREGSVLIDSGVFELSTGHARKHDLTMDQALSMAPDQVDGFSELYSSYVRLMSEYGDQVWGYIEIDQGGRENKIKTRAKLEGIGLRPIPVYHPFNDGWDYFDYLAERYDRICFGNVVQADPATRKRLVATAWERRRKYPHLWIHLLGLTPSEITTAYPINSCDSSTWLSGIRWGTHDATVANRRCWSTGEGFKYMTGSERESPAGWWRATELAGYESAMVKRTMEIIADEQREALGVDIGLFDKGTPVA